MKKGRGNREVWPKAKELADRGCWLSEAARILNIHHATAIYISRKMGFKWPPCPERYARFSEYRFTSQKKQVHSATGLPVSNESTAYVERLMRLAGAA